MFYVKLLRVVILLSALILTACKESVDDPAHMSVVVDGLPIRGNAQDAKLKDFTSCEVIDKYYKCIAKRTVSIYDIPAENAYVLIDRESHTYSSLYLFIEPQKYDADCLEKIKKPYLTGSNSEKCTISFGMSNLRSALNRNGWIVSPNSFQNELHFYNRDYAVRIMLKKHDSQYPNLVIQTVGAEFAMTEWNEAKVVHDIDMAILKQEEALREKEEASKPEAEAFINSMKQ